MPRMPTTLEAGSDAACLCVYDPLAVPEGLAEAQGKRRNRFIAEFTANQRAWLLRTGGDGEFFVRFYVDENVPAEQLRHVVGKPANARLILESDQLCVTGIEDVRRPIPGPDGTDPTLPALSLPRGTYEMSAWTLRWPEDVIAASYEQRAIAEFGADRWAGYRKRSRFDSALSIALLLGGAFCFFATLTKTGRNYFGWQGLVGLWAPWLVAIQVIPRLRREPDGERVAQLTRETQSEYPDYILHLRRL